MCSLAPAKLMARKRSKPLPAGAHDKDLNGRRAEILDCLEEMVLSGGFARLTVGDMARRLHCSRRALYEIAPSKEGLIELTIERFFANIRDAADNDIEHLTDPCERIFAYLIAGVTAAQRMSRTVIADIDKRPPTRAAWNNHIRLRVMGLKTLVEEGIQSGWFRPVHSQLVAEMMYGTLRRIREPDFYTDTGMKTPDAFRELYSLLMEALVIDKESTYFEQFESLALADSSRPSKGVRGGQTLGRSD